ncbi:MAG: amidase [Opitutaceae bacterium]|nr:amidase [Opitutaceae bacterium]
MKRWFAWIVLGTAGVGFPARAEFRFAEATIDRLQAEMAAGTLTARELTAAYIERIEQVDRAGPKLNAVIELNPDALSIAERLDAERKAGRVRGPLHGIPILLKDNIATTDKMETTAGSLALVGAKPPREAYLVTRLREAGAVILGKTNLSEWANFRGTRSVSGWSGRGGQTLNPYVIDRTPSGSSSGSAVAVAANLCVAAIGTETNGSIVSPSSACGIVGIKPTVGLVSRDGVIPLAPSFDTAGPMARTVRDAAIVLAAMAGMDPADEASTRQPAALGSHLAPSPSHGALKGARIGVLRSASYRPNLDPMLERAIQSMRDAGAEVSEAGDLPGSLPAVEVMRYEIKHALNEYFRGLGPSSRMKSIADVIRFNEENWAREMPLFGQQHFVAAAAKGPLTESAYVDARAQCWRVAREEVIDGKTNAHGLDALVAITSGPAGLIDRTRGKDPVFGERGPAGSASSAAAIAGYPSVTVPMGTESELPVGLLFFGRAWTEARLLALAADFEHRAKARVEPRFLPTLSGR